MRICSFVLAIVTLTSVHAAESPAVGVNSLSIPASADGSPAVNVRAGLKPGARVRVANPGFGPRPIAGQLVAIVDDTLVFRPDGSGGIMRAPLGGQTTAELSTAHGNRVGQGVVVGAGVGGVIGALIVVIQRIGEGTSELLTIGTYQAREVSGAPIAIGLAAGGVLGGLVGSTRKVDKWVSLPPAGRVSLGVICDPAPGGRLAVSLPLPRAGR